MYVRAPARWTVESIPNPVTYRVWLTVQALFTESWTKLPFPISKERHLKRYRQTLTA